MNYVVADYCISNMLSRLVYVLVFFFFLYVFFFFVCVLFFFQAEDGIRDLVRSRGLGDVYKRQTYLSPWGKTYPSGSCKKVRGVRFLFREGEL